MQPEATALRFLGQTMTWGELDCRVTALAGALSRRGVEVGDRVLILMLNRTEFIESVLAANLLGAIAVPVNFRMTPPEIAFLVGDCEARIIVTEPVLAAVATAVRELDPMLADVIVTVGTTEDGLLGYEDLLAEEGSAPDPVDIPNDSPALIMYTSGTTGRPKGAVLTHVNLSGQAMTHLFTSGVDLNNDIGFVGVPLFHIAGIGNTITGLLLGRPKVIYPLGAFDPGALLDVLESERVTGIFLVPAQWQVVCAAQRANPRQLKLRVLSWGAAPASDNLLREMAATFPGTQILAAFGQTEMSPVTCMLLGDDAVRKLGSVGKVIPTVAARVVDEDMNDVPIGQVGEIVYRFHSGDLVRQDDEGYVWVVDRKKDMIISGGENIYCAEVENVLAAHPSIGEAAVIGRPHPEWGEVPVAVVALGATAPSGLTLAELVEFLTERLARYKHPKVLEVFDTLPRNPAGKVVKTELRARFGSEDSIDARRKFFCSNGFSHSDGRLTCDHEFATGGVTILRMRCTAPLPSGTLLWSALLPTSRETVITHTKLEQGEGVRQVLPLRHSGRGFVGREIVSARR